MNPYGNYYNPAFFQQGFNPSMNAQQRLMQMEQQYPQQFSQQNIVSQAQQNVIQGKAVSDFETVKATETPLDGSVSYFPLTNGEYIYTKFLNFSTGMSDYGIYKKIINEQKQENENKEFDIKAYLDEKFENLKEELMKGRAKNARDRDTDNKSSNRKVDE
jgi:hypothetical protein